MALWVCNRCTTKFAVGLPYCPQCTSTDAREDGSDVPKNTVYGGASNADLPDDPANAAAPAKPEVEEARELTIVELRDELRDRGLKVSGSKDELLARLQEDDAAKAKALADLDSETSETEAEEADEA
jgi:hypothetical protein